MLTNADITIYHYSDAGFTRRVIKDVFWSDTKQSNMVKSGLVTIDGVKVLIPLKSVPDGLKFTTGHDLIVKGITEFEFNNTDERAISESHKSLIDNHDRVVTVSICDDKRYGSPAVQHLSLMCK